MHASKLLTLIFYTVNKIFICQQICPLSNGALNRLLVQFCIALLVYIKYFLVNLKTFIEAQLYFFSFYIFVPKKRVYFKQKIQPFHE